MVLFVALLLSATVAAAAGAGCPYAATKPVQAYSSWTGQLLTQQQLELMEQNGTTTWCAIEIAPCDPEEGRRVDGSCTNPRYPTLGHGNQPVRRVLPAEFGKDGNPRPPKSNRTLPLPRQKRSRLLAEGLVEDQKFTQLLTHALAFLIGDFANPADELNYVATVTHCCKPEGKLDHECVPNFVPNDDPYMRFSTQRCMNMTRPNTFQYSGCLPNDTNPEWINSAPPLIDMSLLYGETLEALLTKGRKFEGGLLKYEVDDNGLIWPPNYNSTNNTATGCYANNAQEARCHNTPSTYVNSLLGANIFTVWFWRHHNVIATELARRNPCWDDEKLFETTRDIHIALYQQMVYYELFAELMGHGNLIKSNVLSASPGFRDLFNESVAPQLSVEAVYVQRWFHTIQGSNLKLYDESGNYMKNYPVVNLTGRTGFLDHDDNLQRITQGSFRQGCGAFDYIADPDILNIGFGPLQDMLDIPTNDISKGGYFGLPSYTKYREFCSGQSYKSFEDLGDNIVPEFIASLKDSYGDVDDVDLLAGIWLEKYVEGGHVPVTFYCLLVEQLQRYLASDQHWYERPNRPKAFSLEQLLEVRKFSMAELLCTVGDTVTEIQPRAFQRAGPRNKMTSCDNIQKVNFDAWIDSTCTASTNSTSAN